MLAVPTSTAFAGFFPSLILFAVCWVVMFLSALFFVDVTLSFTEEVNLITMAKHTLGKWGQTLSWICYLLLLYSLIAAYIAASGPMVLQVIDEAFHIQLPMWLGPFLLPLIFGGFVYLGTAGVDKINRFFMFALVISYVILVLFVPPHVKLSNLVVSHPGMMYLGLPVLITAFGYHIIIPTLTTYLTHNRKKLIFAIVVGSLVTLCVYVLFQLLVLGSVPLDSLTTAYHQSSNAAMALSKVVHSPFIQVGAALFTFFAIVTSFLGVSLSLSDFLTDGFKIKKSWEGRLLAIALTFIPPLIFVFSTNSGFYMALNYGGVFVALLLIFIPAAMAWTLKAPKLYTSLWTKCLMLGCMLFALLVVIANFLIQYRS